MHGMHGFIPWCDAERLIESASEAATWMPRADAECSEIWVQPIPCAIFRDNLGRYCVFRQIRQSRKDLSQRLSFIVGGHIDHRRGSGQLMESFDETVKREIWEEVGLTVDDVAMPVGIVVDSSSLVASRHIGIIYEIKVDTVVTSKSDEEFSIRSKFNGQFLNTMDRTQLHGKFDPWSSIISAQYMEVGCTTDIGHQQTLPMFDAE